MAIFVTTPKIHKDHGIKRTIATSLAIPDTLNEIEPLLRNQYIIPIKMLMYHSAIAFEISKADFLKMMATGAIILNSNKLLNASQANYG